MKGRAGDNDVLGAIFNQNGGVVNSDFIIESIASVTNPEIAALAGGGFVVVSENLGDARFETFTAAGASVSGAGDAGAGFIWHAFRRSSYWPF